MEVFQQEPSNWIRSTKPAYVALAETYFYEAISDWSASPETAAERLFELGHEAARLDNQSAGPPVPGPSATCG